jgi:hypothetical protein
MSLLIQPGNTRRTLASSRLRSFLAALRLGLAALCLFLAVSNGAASDNALPEDRTTPAFTRTDVDGTSHTLAEYRGRPVVICFACGCRWCHAFGTEWAQMQRGGVLTDAVGQTEAASTLTSKSPVTLVVFMGDAAAARTYAAAAGLDLKQTVLLPDADFKVTRLYHAMPCPRLYVLDNNGLLRYVNNHADDAPQKAAAALLVAKTINGLRRTMLPPPPAPNLTKRPAPKTGQGGKHDKK